MIGGLFQPMHLFVILIVLFLVMGPGKLPQLGASLGKALRELRRSLDNPEQTADQGDVKK